MLLFKNTRRAHRAKGRIAQYMKDIAAAPQVGEVKNYNSFKELVLNCRMHPTTIKYLYQYQQEMERKIALGPSRFQALKRQDGTVWCVWWVMIKGAKILGLKAYSFLTDAERQAGSVAIGFHKTVALSDFYDYEPDIENCSYASDIGSMGGVDLTNSPYASSLGAMSL